MHRPLKYATDQMLQRQVGKTVEEWFTEKKDEPSALVTVQLTVDTDGVIVVDRRTVERWQEDAREVADAK